MSFKGIGEIKFIVLAAPLIACLLSCQNLSQSVAVASSVTLLLLVRFLCVLIIPRVIHGGTLCGFSAGNIVVD